MKNLFFFCSGLSFMFFVSACGGGAPDSVKEAKDSNAARINSDTAANRPANAIAVDRSDADFLVNAASGARMEVHLGKLAEGHAVNRRVRSFGAMMVKDHGEGMRKIEYLAKRKHVVLPDSVSPDQRKEMDDLKKKKGADFDRAYVRMMADDHRLDIKEFEKQAGQGADSLTRVFASTSLQMLRRHLDSANSLVSLLGLNRVSAEPMPPH